MTNFTFTSTITPQASGTILCNPSNSTASPGFYPLLAGNNVTITPVAGSGFSISSTGGGGSGNGTVNSAASGLLAYYPDAGTAVSGAIGASINSSTLTLGQFYTPGIVSLVTGPSAVLLPDITIAGSSPGAIAITPDGSKAYVCTGIGGVTVSVINTTTNTSTTNINAGTTPTSIAITPDGSKAYVTNYTSGDVSVINTTSNTVTNTITVGSNPLGIAITPDGSKAYVCNYGGSVGTTVSVINTTSNTVTNTITVGTAPVSVVITPDGSKAYVCNYISNSVSVINTTSNTVTTTPAVGSNPIGIAVTSDGSKIFVCNFGSSSVSIISTASNTVVATPVVGSEPARITIITNGKAYVSNFNSNSVSVINTTSNTVTNTITVGTGPSAIASSASGNFIYVTNRTSQTLSIINTFTDLVSQTLSTGITPGGLNELRYSGLAAMPTGFRAFVSNNGGGSVTTFSPTTANTAISTVGGTSTSFILPPTNGTSQQKLITDGSGNTSWSTLSNSQSQLGANVTMTSINTFYDGPSVTLSAGTWFISATIMFQATASGAPVTMKLWNGSTVYASTGENIVASTVNSLTVHSIVTLVGSTTVKASSACSVASYKMLAAAITNGAGNNASTITAIQL